MNNLENAATIPVGYNLKLGNLLFSDPQRDRSNAVVQANHPDITLGVNAGDLVRIDFTAKEIDQDGMYVITLDDGWVGYRRFGFKPLTKELYIKDPSGDVPVTLDVLASIKVVGRIKNIYKSA